MEITITRKHCKDTVLESGTIIKARFDNLRDCPLRRAINKQHPEFKVKGVFDGYVIDGDNRQYDYDTALYNRDTLRQLMEKEIDLITLNI